MEVIIQHLKDWFRGYKLGGRSSLWGTARKLYLSTHPNCEMCGTSKSLEVHHAIPINVDKSKELDPDNLITLCGWRGNKCHFLWGHLQNFRKYNKEITNDAIYYQRRLNETDTPKT